MSKLIHSPTECAYLANDRECTHYSGPNYCSYGNNFPNNCPLPNGIIKKKTPKIENWCDLCGENHNGKCSDHAKETLLELDLSDDMIPSQCITCITRSWSGNCLNVCPVKRS